MIKEGDRVIRIRGCNGDMRPKDKGTVTEVRHCTSGVYLQIKEFRAVSLHEAEAFKLLTTVRAL